MNSDPNRERLEEIERLKATIEQRNQDLFALTQVIRDAATKRSKT